MVNADRADTIQPFLFIQPPEARKYRIEDSSDRFNDWCEVRPNCWIKSNKIRYLWMT
jgi:hypothetical protein